jgi:hypothetical protein
MKSPRISWKIGWGCVGRRRYSAPLPSFSQAGFWINILREPKGFSSIKDICFMSSLQENCLMFELSTFKLHVFLVCSSLFIRIFVLSSVCSVCSSFCLFFLLSVLPSACSFNCLFFCSSVFLFYHLSAPLSVCSSACLCFRLYFLPCICSSVFPSRETLLLAYSSITVRSYLVSKFLVVLGEGA